MAKPILICCRDPGAAEVVAAWVKRNPRKSFSFLLEGPAAKIFKRRLGDISILTEVDATSEDRHYSKLVTGTSWSTDLEKRVRAWAKSRGLRTATFLDGWVNYPTRFEVNGRLELPDEIFVYDQKAKEICETQLPNANVTITDNPHWEDVYNEVKAWEKASNENIRHGIRLLFVSQPISDVAKRLTGSAEGYGYTEYSALAAYITYVKPELPKIEEFRLRAHPSEDPLKYRDYFEKNFPDLRVSISTNEDLTKDLAWADWVVGMDTMAMVLALKSNRKVFSCIPAGGRPMEIPIPGIVRLFG